MDCIILAAGKGTRMRPLTSDTPKPLIKLCDNKSIFEHTLENLPESIKNVVVVTGYLSEQFDNFISTNGEMYPFSLTTVVQEEINGTFGAVKQAESAIKCNEFIVLNGDDMYSKDDIEALMSISFGFLLGRAVMSKGYESYDVENGKIVGLVEVLDEEEEILTATGAYKFTKEVFSLDPVAISSGEWGLPQTVLKHYGFEGLEVAIAKNWHPINTHKQLKLVNDILCSA